MVHRHGDDMPSTPSGSAVAPQADRVALCSAIDIGTSNLRMLTARPTPDGFQVIDAFSRQVRLGEGLWDDQQLQPAAIQRAVDALEICRDRIYNLQVARFRAIGTEACRRAGNVDAFVELAKQRAEITIDIIDTKEEARLALSACRPLLPGDCQKAVVFDIGGGSTQIIWAGLVDGSLQRKACISIPYGVIRLADRFGDRLFDRSVFAACVDEIAASMADFCSANDIRAVMDDGGFAMVGTSGTVTTLASMAQRLTRYDRRKVDGYILTADEIDFVCGEICASSVEDLAAVPGIGTDRADLVVAGCAIFEAIRRRWPIDMVRVADRGLREGILVDLMGINRRGQK